MLFVFVCRMTTCTERRGSRAGPPLAVLALLAALAAPVPAATLRVLGLDGPVPGEWRPQPPSSSMRLAQALVPPDASFVVYYFGPGQGGSVALNVARWQSQFSRADGTPVQPLVREIEVQGMPVTRVELRGDYARGVGTNAAAPVLGDHVLLAAVVQTPRGALFVHLYGPAATVDAASADFDAFLTGLRAEAD